MQFVLDNLVATIIATTVFIILLAVNFRNQSAAVEATNFYMLKQQQLTFIDVIKHDMQNVSRLESVAEHATDSTFTFRAQTSSTDTTKQQVVYRRRRAGSFDGTPLYRIERYVNGTLAGGSPSVLTTWQIQALNDEDNPVADPNDGRRVYIQLEMALPYQRDEASVEQARWEATFVPVLLRQNNVL